MGIDSEAVVNPRLQVYGIQRLRVVDSSIMPEIVAGHTNAGIFYSKNLILFFFFNFNVIELNYYFSLSCIHDRRKSVRYD